MDGVAWPYHHSAIAPSECGSNHPVWDAWWQKKRVQVAGMSMFFSAWRSGPPMSMRCVGSAFATIAVQRRV